MLWVFFFFFNSYSPKEGPPSGKIWEAPSSSPVVIWQIIKRYRRRGDFLCDATISLQGNQCHRHRVSTNQKWNEKITTKLCHSSRMPERNTIISPFKINYSNNDFKLENYFPIEIIFTMIFLRQNSMFQAGTCENIILSGFPKWFIRILN